MSEAELRLECLKLAEESMGHSHPIEIITAAHMFYAYVHNGAILTRPEPSDEIASTTGHAVAVSRAQ